MLALMERAELCLNLAKFYIFLQVFKALEDLNDDRQE